MWHKIVSYFRKDNLPITIPVTNKNILIITAFINKGIITVSYKGHTQRGLFTDNTLKNMVHGKHFDKSTNSFLGSVAKLISQIIKQK